MAICPALQSDAFLSSLLNTVDCHARTIGASGYQALADAASPPSIAVTGLLTIFVALFGLRMMMGELPPLRSVVMAVVKIGLVLTLAGSWPAYQTVVYGVVVDGPAEIGDRIGSSAGLATSGLDLVGRLQNADNGIVRLTNYGTGREEFATLPTATPGTPPQRYPIADNPALGWARVLFLVGTAGALAIVRLSAGILLALAPLLAGLILFDLGRGIVIGWARALVFTVLASIAVTLVLGVQLALLEPWLAQTIALRQAQALAAAAPVELLVLALSFSVALFGIGVILLKLAFTISVPSKFRAMTRPDEAHPNAASNERRLLTPSSRPVEPLATSRATVIADSVAAAQRRESFWTRSQGATAAATVGARSGAGAISAGREDMTIPSDVRALRRARSRKSLSAAMRDRRG